jgi:DNA-binding NtrC family response regulator
MSLTPTCLIVDSDEQHARALSALCREEGFETSVLVIDQQSSISEKLGSADTDIAFMDVSLGLPTLTRFAEDALAGAELFAMADEDDPGIAEACVRAGFSFYFGKPIAAASLTQLLRDITEEISAESDTGSKQAAQATLDQFGLMRGSSRAMRKLFRVLRKVGPTDTTALIIGESGTGKELIAETLHTISERADKTYLTLNCSALAENLIESELFGHEKGSFSGAHKTHIGFFERADGGTLFLDEITEMLPELQAKLLRALESGEIRRVGAVEPIDVNVRVIAATNRDPLDAVAEGQLREDLYYRLAHVNVHVPPLRRRQGDIEGLARFFLVQLNERHGTSVTISDDALAALEAYSWPGNVRQLRHAVERAYIVSQGEIGQDAFVFDGEDGAIFAGGDISVKLGMSLAECERRIILANLEHNEGDKKETAAVLGISLKTLYNRLRDYDGGDTQGD